MTRTLQSASEEAEAESLESDDHYYDDEEESQASMISRMVAIGSGEKSGLDRKDCEAVMLMALSHLMHTARIDDEILKAFQRGTYNHVEREIDACTKV